MTLSLGRSLSLSSSLSGERERGGKTGHDRSGVESLSVVLALWREGEMEKGGRTGHHRSVVESLSLVLERGREEGGQVTLKVFGSLSYSQVTLALCLNLSLSFSFSVFVSLSCMNLSLSCWLRETAGRTGHSLQWCSLFYCSGYTVMIPSQPRTNPSHRYVYVCGTYGMSHHTHQRRGLQPADL